MSNVTNFTHFVLSAYLDLGLFRYLVFLLLLLFYVLTLSSNLLLITVIVMNRTLVEPMYLFLCSLFLSELYGATMLFPMLLHHILQQLRQITTYFCFLQIYCLHSYCTVEYLNIAILSYDRYIAICFPLQYHSHMTRARMIKLIAFPVCFSGSKSLRQKALSTCLPHLVTVINFTIGGSFELVQSRFNMSSVNMVLRVFLSLYCITSQPLLSPVIYGLNISKLRTLCKGLLLARLHKI
ncbi:hypothetical protein WMY93_028907 [Mugilogobius chulae]|uniref:G-protein coupled receptors family 1 profile domain-containing protein n=1 Tax=Mugilogobius chulae TaxID=88201 RepID=A0AAW0MWE5_9GOBI